MANVSPSSASSDVEKVGIKEPHLEHHEVAPPQLSALRIDGDDEDHMHEPPMTFRRFMSLLAMAFLWTGSQIPVYLFGMSSTSNNRVQ
jgi:hypothetical protein